MIDINKIKHKVNIRIRGRRLQDDINKKAAKQAILMTLQYEKVDKLCVVNILVTGDKELRDFNREYRGIDRPTDVLSFPMQTFSHAGWDGCAMPEFDEDTGDLPLGDIVISKESIKRQAKENGNTTEKETTYLLIHSTLHLLGYDHESLKSKRVMRTIEKQVFKECRV